MMSALPPKFTPKADIADAMRNVRFVPKADILPQINSINGLRCRPGPNRAIEIKRHLARVSNPAARSEAA